MSEERTVAFRLCDEGGREVQEKELWIVDSIYSTSVYWALTVWQSDARDVVVHL